MQKIVRCRSCRSSSSNACPPLYNDRCQLVDPDSADVLVLNKVVLPVVMQDLFSGLDVQKIVDVPHRQFLTPMVVLPVEIPQGAFLGRGVHVRRCFWRRWPDSAESCGDSTGAVLDQVVGMPFERRQVSMVVTVQKPVLIPQVRFLGKVVDVLVVRFNDRVDVQTVQRTVWDSLC